MTWVIHDRGKAEIAGCDLTLDQAIYVLTGHDVESAYNDLLDERSGDPGGGSQVDHWAALSPATQERIIEAAKKSVEGFMGSGNYWDAIRDGITDGQGEPLA